MEPIKKEDVNQEVFDLYDYYVHGKIERRTFLNKLSLFTAGSVTVPSLLNFLMPNYALAQQVKQDDKRVHSEYIEYDSPKGGGTIKGLLCMPSEGFEKLPAIVVVHENRGLNPYIEDVARRAALAGFVALAPDALTPLGGYPGNDDEGRTMQRQRDRYEMLEDFIAAFDYLKKHKKSTGKVGVVGFCFGGWISNMMAVKVPDLGAAVPFYGGQPKEDIDKIKAPIQLHFASLDKRVNAGWPDYESALKAEGKAYEAYMYDGVNHGFHNDTTPRFDSAAAELAWKRTVEFFKKHLS